MPMLALDDTGTPFRYSGSASISCSRSASMTTSRSAFMSSTRIANSSPPSRAIRSLGRTKRPHAPGELDQQGVARAVAEAVVDQLEPVEVEEQHAETAIAVPPHGRDRAGELFGEVVAIREVGEVVVVRDVLQPRPRPAAVR